MMRAVVVYHLDRFARDLAGGLDTLDGFAKRGVELHVVGRGRIEAESASGFLTTGVELLMAEHYRRAIGEKTRDALARLRAEGRRTSRFPPYGFRFGSDATSLEPVAAEQRAIAEARRLRPGRSLRALSAKLARRGYVARCGRPFAPKVLAALGSPCERIDADQRQRPYARCKTPAMDLRSPTSSPARPRRRFS